MFNNIGMRLMGQDRIVFLPEKSDRSLPANAPLHRMVYASGDLAAFRGRFAVRGLCRVKIFFFKLFCKLFSSVGLRVDVAGERFSR